MYNQQDLDEAVAAGAIDASAAASLRNFLDQSRGTLSVYEEQFRLVTSFNDIFVSIASAKTAAWIAVATAPTTAKRTTARARAIARISAPRRGRGSRCARAPRRAAAP